jgi:hypothetical protein
MTGQKDHRADRYDRARSHAEPGAHSGAESLPQERSVPGTASAKEGYQAERGTTAGKPLEGIEAEERARREPDTGTDPNDADRACHRDFFLQGHGLGQMPRLPSKTLPALPASAVAFSS